MSNDPSNEYTAHPLEHDLFEWHCTMRGPAGTEFEGGLYHFRIILPSEYPFRPPSIMMLTPSGRFECGTKICISFTSCEYLYRGAPTCSYLVLDHEELWQPAWGVRTAIIGLQGFFPLKGEAAVGIGGVEYPESERRRLAQLYAVIY
jgi:ubiquitin-conjugating enzyme E2 J1